MRSLVLNFRDQGATAVDIVGGKAAALAKASAAGFDVLPAAVLTTAFAEEYDRSCEVVNSPEVRAVFNDMMADRDGKLVLRSSAPGEDTADSSMAGQFESVLGVATWAGFVNAVRTVLDSRITAGVPGAPIAVLVQTQVESRFGGVMFGVDPVSGRSDRRVIAAVHGGPDALVSGEVDGARYLLDDSGKVLEFQQNDGPDLPSPVLDRLNDLGRSVADLFGRAQDVEWAVDHDDTLYLLQSRPVTTEIKGVPQGPIYGPGPVAETFPEALARLEIDLWVTPLKEGILEATRLAGSVSDRELRTAEGVITVGGYVALDLQLTGEEAKLSKDTRWNLALKVRKLRHAWRVGRLRAALPALADRLVDRVDADLAAIPPLTELTSRQLVGVIRRGQMALKSLHAHEVLMGLLSSPDNQLTTASVALRVLAEGRRDGFSDDEILMRSPVVLGLTPPKVAAKVELPPDASAPDLFSTKDRPGVAEGVLREALRLRARWVQELTGRAAWEMAERLAARSAIVRPEDVRCFTFEEVESFATKRSMTTPQLVTREHHSTEPLPARFQLSDTGKVIPVLTGPNSGGGTGAGGGRATGVVTHSVDDPPEGSILVTSTLRPNLGPLLPRLSGVVCETGSVLSHLAILARESGVATVVGCPGASTRWPEGTVIEVNGATGTVEVVERSTVAS